MMMIMPSNNCTSVVHTLARSHPGSIGWLISPHSGWKNPPKHIPYALDNGAFNGFDETKFLKLLSKAKSSHTKPLWVAVPDVVADAEATNKLWYEWNGKIEYPLAFVAQDGHEPNDVPKDAFAVFIGGSTEWKIKNAHKFKRSARWLHVGRVNTIRRLRWARRIGADSVDGSGWFKNLEQKKDMINFITGMGQLPIFDNEPGWWR